jgi:hypothetical protein
MKVGLLRIVAGIHVVLDRKVILVRLLLIIEIFCWVGFCLENDWLCR